MTIDDLRTEIITGIDSILSAPWIVQKFVTAEHKRLLRAQRNLWQRDDGTQLTVLLALLNAEPQRAGPEDDKPVLTAISKAVIADGGGQLAGVDWTTILQIIEAALSVLGFCMMMTPTKAALAITHPSRFASFVIRARCRKFITDPEKADAAAALITDHGEKMPLVEAEAAFLEHQGVNMAKQTTQTTGTVTAAHAAKAGIPQSTIDRLVALFPAINWAAVLAVVQKYGIAMLLDILNALLGPTPTP